MQDFTHIILDPVTGLEIGSVTLTREAEPTDDEWADIDAAHLDSSRPRTPDRAKADAADRINAAYQTTLDAGIAVGGLTLASSPSDQQAFVSLAVLLREAEELGQITDADNQTITDAAGQPQTMTVATLRGVLVSYGLTIQALFNARAAKLAAIAAAATVEQADAISW